MNALLRQSHGLRLAVLVNDFGSINIDAELIENQDGETISLTNGCICCSINDNLGDTLRQLAESHIPPDQVIVEASGVAYPEKIARYGTMPGFTLQGILVVVDAETIRAKSKDKYVGQTVTHQLKDADLLILNKTDLVSDEQKQEVRSWLADVAPGSHIIETQYGVVPHELLMDIGSGLDFRDDDVAEHVHQHGDEFASRSYASDAPLKCEAVEEFLNSLPESIIRAKGILYLRDEPDRQTILQLVGKRWILKSGAGWNQNKPESRLVVIGIRDQFGPEALDALWQSCIDYREEEV